MAGVPSGSTKATTEEMASIASGALEDSPFGRPGDIITASDRSSNSDEGLL